MFCLTKKLACGIAIVSLLSCGVDSPNKTRTSKAQENTLKLTTSFDDYKILIEGCSSGYSKTITKASSDVALYLNDLGCLAKLLEYQKDGETFLPQTSNEFIDYGVSDSGFFVGENTGIVQQIVITKQLTSPLERGASVKYALSKTIKAESTHTLFSIEPAKETYASLEKEKLDFKMHRFYMNDQAPVEDSVLYTFELTCKKLMAISSSPSCAGIDISQIQYKLYQADTGKFACKKKQVTDCEESFDGSEPFLHENDNFIPPSPSIPKGGITLPNLKAPDVTKDNKWRLILKKDNSYLFFDLYFTLYR